MYWSFSKPYVSSVDRITSIADSQKALVKPCYHERIDRLAERYSKKLADLINKNSRVNAYYPSSFVTDRSGRSRKKASRQSSMYASLAGGWRKLDEMEDSIAGFSERKGVKL